MMETQIKARIVKIISDKKLVINKGVDDGVHKNDSFTIISKNKGQAVKDPETGKTLGYLDAIKAHVVVTFTYPNMSIVEPPIHHFGGISDNLLSATRLKSAMYRPFEERTEQNSLNVDLSQITGDLEESDEPIEIGDFAVKD